MLPARSLFAVLLAATALLAPTSVDAGSRTPGSIGWSKASMTAATTYFPEGASAMVVGVGDDAQPVTTALLETLQASDSFELVIDARALGELGGLSDGDIVQRAFARPIQRVAFVRVFPAGGSVKAVVTVYAAQGQVTAAFTLAPGKTLAQNPTPAAAEDGVRRDEMVNVQSTGGSPGIVPTAADDGEVTYERRQLVGVSGYGAVVSLENVSFFKNGRLISDTPSLYEALGMKTEATVFRSRDADSRKWLGRGVALGTIGVLGVCGFGTWWLARAASSDYDYDTGVTTEHDTTLPMLLTVGSAALVVAGGYVIRSHPRPSNLTPDEAVSLVEAHKARKQRTGALGGRVTGVQLAPTATPSGAGFLLSGSF